MRKKQQRFIDNQHRANIIEPGKPVYDTIKGQWNTAYFNKDQDIIVELACGKGAYTLGLAQQYPKQHFIGIDIKGDRLWVGSTAAMTQQLENVAFLRAPIIQLASFFTPGEITSLWITFPDPRPGQRDAKRRLTSPRFLDLYQSLLRPKGLVHLKTDDADLFNYTSIL